MHCPDSGIVTFLGKYFPSFQLRFAIVFNVYLESANLKGSIRKLPRDTRNIAKLVLGAEASGTSFFRMEPSGTRYQS